jgi:hypothetical protein
MNKIPAELEKRIKEIYIAAHKFIISLVPDSILGATIFSEKQLVWNWVIQPS